MKKRPALVLDDERLFKAAATQSFREFTRQAWPIVVPNDAFQSGYHLDAVTTHLEAVQRRQIRTLIIEMPPRFAKSTITDVLWPAWLWLKNPGERVLTASYSLSLAERDAAASRTLIQSPWYQQRWGSRVKLDPNQNTLHRYSNMAKGARSVTSVGGSTTGEGGDVRILDDPHNVKDGESTAERQAAVLWVERVWSSRGNNPAVDVQVVIAQRVHYADVIGTLLKQGGWERLSLAMQYSPSRVIQPSSIGWKDPRREPGELLWPSRYNAQYVEDKKRLMGSYAYSAQYQQDPAPSEGGMFKREDFRTYNPEKKADIVKRANDLKWSWDMTFKETTDGSYVVGQLWARLGADYFLLHQVRRRMSFSATIQAILGTRLLYPDAIIGHLVEAKANGDAVVDTLKHDVAGLILVEPEGGKEARASRITALIEAHNVHLPDGESWVGDYIEEFARFPVGEHDDQVDATSQALTKMAKTGRSGFAIISFTKTWDRRGIRVGTMKTFSAGQTVAEEVKQPSPAMLTKALGRHCPACDLPLSDPERIKKLCPRYQQHPVDDSAHRSICRQCREEFKKSAPSSDGWIQVGDEMYRDPRYA